MAIRKADAEALHGTAGRTPMDTEKTQRTRRTSSWLTGSPLTAASPGGVPKTRRLTRRVSMSPKIGRFVRSVSVRLSPKLSPRGASARSGSLTPPPGLDVVDEVGQGSANAKAEAAKSEAAAKATAEAKKAAEPSRPMSSLNMDMMDRPTYLAHLGKNMLRLQRMLVKDDETGEMVERMCVVPRKRKSGGRETEDERLGKLVRKSKREQGGLAKIGGKIGRRATAAGRSSVQSLLGAANKKASSAAVAQSTLRSVSRLRIIPRMLLPVSELMLLIQLSLLGYVMIVNVPAALLYRVETHVTGWGGEVEGWVHVAVQLGLLLVAIVVIQPILLKNLVLINGLLGSHHELMHQLYRIHANLSIKDEVSVLLFTVTFHANRAHNLTCSP